MVYLNLTQNITSVINEEKASLCFAEAVLKLTITVRPLFRGEQSCFFFFLT